MKLIFKIILYLFFIIGAGLLLINILGLFMSLSNNKIYQEKIDPRFGITLSYKEAIKTLNTVWRSDNIEQKLTIANSVVHKGIAHYWIKEDFKKYNLRIPFHENFVLNLLSFFSPAYKYYEYCTLWKKALERGVGLCSQQVMVLSSILKEMGIENNIIGLDGHVVLQATVDEAKSKYWILDPDYGVIIKHDLKTVEQNPEIIVPFYQEAGFGDVNLVEIYKTKGNIVYKNIYDYPECSNGKTIRQVSYILKWIIPLVLILPCIIFCFLKIKKRKEKSHVWSGWKGNLY